MAMRFAIVGVLSGFLMSNPSLSQTRDLSFYLANALAASPLIKDQQYQVLSATLDSARIRALQKPQVTANALAVYAPSAGNYFGYDRSVSNGGTYDGLVSAAQPLFNRRVVTGQLQSVFIKRDSLQNSLRVSRRDLKKSIVAQYIACYLDFEQVQFQDTLLKKLIEQELALKKMVSAGAFTQSDYLTFLVSRGAQEVTYQQAVLTFHNDLASLNLLSGIADTATVAVEKPDIRLDNVYSIGEYPGNRKFVIDSLRLVNQRTVLDNAYRPRLNWLADVGFTTSTPGIFYRTFGTSFGLMFSVPIYDGKQRKIQYKQLALEESSRKAYQHFFNLQFSEQINQYQRQIADIEVLKKKLESQVIFAQKLVAVDSKLLNIGVIRVNDFILAINNLRNATFTLTQQQINELLIINQLNYLSTTY